jgi:hypothetical protein
MILIFFLQKRMGGGTTTYTAHLAEGFRAIKQDVHIMRVTMNSRDVDRSMEFGEYGHEITTVSPAAMLKLARQHPSILAAPTSPKNVPVGFIAKLLKAGTVPVLHDLTQRKLFPERCKRFICIRQSMESVVKGAQYIGHPYMRQTTIGSQRLNRTRLAISTARIDSSKRTALILKANRMLPKKKRVEVLGTEFRLYSYGLAKRYKGLFKQSGKVLNWPLTFRAPVDLCLSAYYNVDLSRFPQDGGGTQYTQLEAMDAGCINVMHHDWFYDPFGGVNNGQKTGDMIGGAHALTISSPEELAAIMEHRGNPKRDKLIREACYKLLEKHSAVKIARQYLEVL